MISKNMLDFNFSTGVIICTIIGISTLLYATIFGLCNFKKILKFHKNCLPDLSSPSNQGLPKASVIVYAYKSQNFIRQYLESLLNQDYPDFEIIIVNDSVKDDMTKEIVEDMCNNHSNLHITYVPQDSRNVSRRKLAITLGIKAATGDVVITTAANCKIKSDQWLKQMMRHFCNSKTEIVLGYTHIDKVAQQGIGKWYRAFDSLTTAIQWIGSALAKRTYRGDGFNLAYRKSVFFNNKGFAKTIHLENGEDDLFINQIATTDNCVVELSDESQLIVDWAGNEQRMWFDMKERYTFTSRYLKTNAFYLQNIFYLSLWLSIFLLCESSIIALPNLIPAISSLILIIGYFAYMIYLYRQVANKLNSIKLFWALPLFVLIKPLVDFAYKLRFNGRKSNNFTWQRKKN